ncbi:MAG TPA: hypothetical protein VF707_00755 [Ardenticatenaceae bacterium]
MAHLKDPRSSSIKREPLRNLGPGPNARPHPASAHPPAKEKPQPVQR